MKIKNTLCLIMLMTALTSVNTFAVAKNIPLQIKGAISSDSDNDNNEVELTIITNIKIKKDNVGKKLINYIDQELLLNGSLIVNAKNNFEYQVTDFKAQAPLPAKEQSKDDTNYDEDNSNYEEGEYQYKEE